jgi:hypothetical protein
MAVCRLFFFISIVVGRNRFRLLLFPIKKQAEQEIKKGKMIQSNKLHEKELNKVRNYRRMSNSFYSEQKN